MFTFDDNATYMMPAHFGGHVPAPEATGDTMYHDVTNVAVGYVTDQKMLEQYVPDSFEILQPVLSVAASTNRGCDWLAGRSYNIISVSLPFVKFKGNEEVEGSYCLVLWEDLTHPILTGREQTGVPKIYADIEDTRLFLKRWASSASTFGTTFMNISLDNVREASDEEVAAMNAQKTIGNMMAWRYIPNIGRPGAALSHATLFPQQPGDTVKAWYGEPQVTWNAVTFEQSPTQHHIINALAELPILEYRFGIAINGPHTLKSGIARELH